MEVAIAESEVEEAALAWLEGSSWTVRNGTEIALGAITAERGDYTAVVLERRLRDTLLPKPPPGTFRVRDAEMALEARI